MFENFITLDRFNIINENSFIIYVTGKWKSSKKTFLKKSNLNFKSPDLVDLKNAVSFI